ncbi:MAG: hypothetical protein ACRD2I_09775 [Vicinamibacterales bacterium]
MASNDLDAELSAMQDIATTLHRLDPSTRARVLRWMVERFQADAAFIVNSASAISTVDGLELRGVPAPARTTDETLSVESLTDFFDADQPAAPKKPADAAPQSITGMLKDLVAEVQDLAREWDKTEDSPVDKHGPDPLAQIAS